MAGLWTWRETQMLRILNETVKVFIPHTSNIRCMLIEKPRNKCFTRLVEKSDRKFIQNLTFRKQLKSLCFVASFFHSPHSGPFYLFSHSLAAVWRKHNSKIQHHSPVMIDGDKPDNKRVCAHPDRTLWWLMLSMVGVAMKSDRIWRKKKVCLNSIIRACLF